MIHPQVGVLVEMPTILLLRILAHQGIAFDADVMGQVPGASFRADSEGPLNSQAVDTQIFNRNETAVFDFNRVVTGLACN